MYKKILLPYDGSPHSERALQEVVKMVPEWKQDVRITLMHVVPSPPVSVYQLYLKTDINVDGIIERQGEEVLEKAAALLQEKGILYDLDVKVGDPAHEICLQSKMDNYDLIVMGSRGMGYIKELMLGSVSHKVLQHTHCPVLIVK
ncbi:universal stress protein [Brevibacillus ruminantium]|uniref:Universal stress protein n=1 Tax=Brevibacillus ruminantium TaxID=2950604 RepID=A0ABY4WG28_9BACL|nr:universal stress protein [Brevibacillus ruminantium]USG65814.1 universal stress protein [Brevibacillus ruminantium]